MIEKLPKPKKWSKHSGNLKITKISPKPKKMTKIPLEPKNDQIPLNLKNDQNIP